MKILPNQLTNKKVQTFPKKKKKKYKKSRTTSGPIKFGRSAERGIYIK